MQRIVVAWNIFFSRRLNISKEVSGFKFQVSPSFLNPKLETRNLERSRYRKPSNK
jgi:hypothetical protein